MVLDSPNVDPKLPKAARRASGMAWGSRTKGLSQDFLNFLIRPSGDLLFPIDPFKSALLHELCTRATCFLFVP